MISSIMTIALLFLFGISVGSFLNVLIDRLPKGEQVFQGRSYCDCCRKTIAWYDLTPLLSFLLLGGKCRYCKEPISWYNPLVETTTGFAYLLVYSSQLPITKFVFSLIVISGSIVIFFTDLKYRIIPDQILILLIVSSFIFVYFFADESFLNYLLSGLFMFFVFLFLFLLTSAKGMGFGDVKYSFFMGLFLGFPKVVVSFYLAFLTGALFSLILIIKGKKRLKGTIAFGPFLVMATIIAFFWGEYLWAVFMKIIGM